MASDSPLDRILRPLDQLITAVVDLEIQPKGKKQNRALQRCLRLACRNLGNFLASEFANLHTSVIMRAFTSGEDALAILDQQRRDDLRICLWIGETIDDKTKGMWSVAPRLMAAYEGLVGQLAAQHFAPLNPTNIPRDLTILKSAICALAEKKDLPSDERETARSLLTKVASVSAVAIALVGFEQDIVPFTKDTIRFVQVVVHGIDHTLHSPGFIVIAPPSDHRASLVSIAAIDVPNPPPPDTQLTQNFPVPGENLTARPPESRRVLNVSQSAISPGRAPSNRGAGFPKSERVVGSRTPHVSEPANTPSAMDLVLRGTGDGSNTGGLDDPRLRLDDADLKSPANSGEPHRGVDSPGQFDPL